MDRLKSWYCAWDASKGYSANVNIVDPYDEGAQESGFVWITFSDGKVHTINVFLVSVQKPAFQHFENYVQEWTDYLWSEISGEWVVKPMEAAS